MLKESILKFLKLDSLMTHLSGYLEARIELLKVEIKEDIARAVARTIIYVVLAFVATLFIFFISIAVAYMLGEHIGVFGGFAVVAAFYALIGIILWVTRNTISEKLEQQLKGILKQTKK